MTSFDYTAEMRQRESPATRYHNTETQSKRSRGMKFFWPIIFTWWEPRALSCPFYNFKDRQQECVFVQAFFLIRIFFLYHLAVNSADCLCLSLWKSVFGKLDFFKL